jgi:hypothetical protein
MNAIHFFDWGFENNKYKEAKLKKESDKILNELHTSPVDRSWYYRKGAYWYKYTYPKVLHHQSFSWKDVNESECDELVPYFNSGTILFLKDCKAKKIVLNHILGKIGQIDFIPFAKQIEKITIPNSFEIYNNAATEQILLREKNNTMNNTLINCYALEKKKIIDKIVIE